VKLTLSGVVGIDITAADIRRRLSSATGALDIDIASPGGYVDEGIEVYNLLKGYHGRKTARLVGTVASAATLISCAADRIVALPQSLWMIHGSSLSMAGNASDLEHGAEILRKYDSLLAAAYMAKTGKDRETICAWMKAESWMTPEEALAAGFVDAIEGAPAAARANIAAARAQVHALAAKGHRPEELTRAAALLGATPAPRIVGHTEEERATLARIEALGYRVDAPAAELAAALPWVAAGIPAESRRYCEEAGLTPAEAAELPPDLRRAWLKGDRF